MSAHEPLPSAERGVLLRGWGAVTNWLAASPVAWISLGVSIIVPTATVVYNYASMGGQIAGVSYQVTRNREETADKLQLMNTRIDNMYTAMNAIYSMRTDIEVIKTHQSHSNTQIQQINEALRRIEGSQRRGPMAEHHGPKR